MSLKPTLEEKAKALENLSLKIHKLRVKLTYMEEERRKLKLEYESLDRHLAMSDGRFKKEVRKTSSHAKPVGKLTNEQILRIVKELQGV